MQNAAVKECSGVGKLACEWLIKGGNQTGSRYFLIGIFGRNKDFTLPGTQRAGKMFCLRTI
ncbi:hypothetical protein SAMN02927897_00183 [Kosakonia sacchari]|uniref:Uncharacterized protein n=1 Tax=Kosakonia sacchari TaxID=1158459 RepID=A0A1G4X9Z5_9ENTR|nr:hypothetical protein SAMN02927897_00183 [Kosakonia sacchari]